MNRIMTGFAFAQERASHVILFREAGKAELIEAYNKLLSAGTEASALLEHDMSKGGRAHTTSEVILADAIIKLLAAAHNNGLNLSSAVVMRLQHAEGKLAHRHART